MQDSNYYKETQSIKLITGPKWLELRKYVMTNSGTQSSDTKPRTTCNNAQH